jgi:endonuclease/exonuclease/phosphatase family metal-dependent hydrolase
MRIRIATFNVENLLSRRRFGTDSRPDARSAMALFGFNEARERDAVERSLTVMLEDDKRQMTALALTEANADILCLQEVDNLAVLEAFFANYVHRICDKRYGHFRLLHGNDERGIDVAFACRRDLISGRADIRMRSHAGETYESLGLFDPDLAALGYAPQHRIFKRDCLEVELSLGEHPLSLFICHFKSMSGATNDSTGPVRRAEALAVRGIIMRKYGKAWRDADFVVAGDLNDYREVIEPVSLARPNSDSAIASLTDDFCVNPVASLPADARWTHFHRDWSERERRLTEQYVQLDYVLLSPALARRNVQPPVDIIRHGLPYRVPLDPRAQDRSVSALVSDGIRYPRIGWDRPKASDHCPLVVELVL